MVSLSDLLRWEWRSLLDELEFVSLICYAVSVGVWVGHCGSPVHCLCVDVRLWSWQLRGVGRRSTSIDVPIKELKMQCAQVKDTCQFSWDLHIECLKDDIG